jgi:acyl-CoA thioester hydrolase
MSQANLHRCEVELVVPFHDVDAMQVVWHGHYLKYFEIARALLFDQAGIDLYKYHAESGFLFPVVRTQIKHIHPLRYRDRFVCAASVADLKRKIVVDFEIRLAEGGTLCARGRTEQVAIRSRDFKLELSVPEYIRKALGVS